MDYFGNSDIKLDILKRKAYNLRRAKVADETIPSIAADMDYLCALAIKQALLVCVEEGYFSYTLKLGLPAFNQVFSNYVKETKGEEIRAGQVLAVDSVARAMFTVAKTFLKSGSGVIVSNPYDFLFREPCLATEATPISYAAKLDTENRKMDLSRLEERISGRTEMIGLCNPHSPCGLVYAKEELEAIMRLCEKHNLLIMNDEIWSDILYPDVQFNNTYCLGEERYKHVASVLGFSKSFGLAGLRVGCVCMDDDEKFQKLVDVSDVLSTVGGVASLSQIAAITAMEETQE